MKHVVRSLLLAVGVIALPVFVGAQAAPTSVAGDWNASMNTPGGVRPMKLVLTVDGETLTGVVKREAGDVPLKGTVKGNVVTFTYSVDYNGNALALTVTMTVAGDAMQGTVSFGGQAEDVFTATRAPKSP